MPLLLNIKSLGPTSDEVHRATFLGSYTWTGTRIMLVQHATTPHWQCIAYNHSTVHYSHWLVRPMAFIKSRASGTTSDLAAVCTMAVPAS